MQSSHRILLYNAMSESVFKRLLYCIFPRRCDLCGDVVPISSKRCDACLHCEKIEGEACEMCGMDKASCTCKDSHHKPEYEQIVAPFYYSDNVVKAVYRLKSNGYSELDVTMAEEIVKCIKKQYHNINFDCITYVPLSADREKARGYNQSRLIAEEISKMLDIPVEHTFYKAYENPPQRNQNARMRRANVFGAFDVNDGVNPQGKTYLVVDDVKTTGATLSECAAVLDSYGSTAVYTAVFAIRKKSARSTAG